MYYTKQNREKVPPPKKNMHIFALFSVTPFFFNHHTNSESFNKFNINLHSFQQFIPDQTRRIKG